MFLSNSIFAAFLATTLAASTTKPQDTAIPIISQSSDVNPDGTFYNQFETANGILYQESGTLKNPGTKEEVVSVQGTASWPDQAGTPIRIDWQADENGAVFQGAHIPTPPPIPALIQRALDWLKEHPYEEKNDKKT